MVSFDQKRKKEKKERVQCQESRRERKLEMRSKKHGHGHAPRHVTLHRHTDTPTCQFSKNARHVSWVTRAKYIIFYIYCVTY